MRTLPENAIATLLLLLLPNHPHTNQHTFISLWGATGKQRSQDPFPPFPGIDVKMRCGVSVRAQWERDRGEDGEVWRRDRGGGNKISIYYEI